MHCRGPGNLKSGERFVPVDHCRDRSERRHRLHCVDLRHRLVGVGRRPIELRGCPAVSRWLGAAAESAEGAVKHKRLPGSWRPCRRGFSGGHRG